MNEPTSETGVTDVWYELAGVEIDINTGAHSVKLPNVGPGVLGPWQVNDSHLSTRSGERGQPTKTLVVLFSRPIVAGDAPQPRRVAAPVARPAPARPPARPSPGLPAPGTARRLQPPPTVGVAPSAPVAVAAAPDAVTAVEQVVDGLVEAASSAVSGLVNAAAGAVSQALPRAPTPAPRPSSGGTGGAMTCTCPEPDPAVEDSTRASVPCRGCGGWIANEQPQPTA